jgi:hypothetical protein
MITLESSTVQSAYPSTKIKIMQICSTFYRHLYGGSVEVCKPMFGSSTHLKKVAKGFERSPMPTYSHTAIALER